MREDQNTRTARRLRQATNAPEHVAWAALRTLRAQGFPVRRQHPVGRFVVDFAIVKARLVIEIDGGVHQFAGVASRDKARQTAIENLGWRVVRVSNEVALSPDHLMARIQSELGL